MHATHHTIPWDYTNKQDFFQSQVGGVQLVSMSYNEKGNFKGIATIIFKSHKFAVAAVGKYNNAPIDGGATKLRMELVIDPSKKPLASRIVANTPAKAVKGDVKQKLKEKLQAKKKAVKTKAAVEAKPKAKKAKPAKAAKPEKKTVEQLDQEMADYFKN